MPNTEIRDYLTIRPRVENGSCDNDMMIFCSVYCNMLIGWCSHQLFPVHPFSYSNVSTNSHVALILSMQFSEILVLTVNIECIFRICSEDMILAIIFLTLLLEEVSSLGRKGVLFCQLQWQEKLLRLRILKRYFNFVLV